MRPCAPSETPAPDPTSLLELTVVIPAYNEARRLPDTVRRVREHLATRGDSWEIIVVSDGSHDDPGTALLDQLREERRVRLIEYPDNQGKGAAVRWGVRAALGRRILFTDADLSTPIEELERLEAALTAGADVVIASRRLPGSRLEPPQGFARQFVGKSFSLLVRGLTGLPHLDTQCGFKLFTRASAAAIFAVAREDRFAFDVELLCAAHDLGLRVTEVPVLWRNAETSSVRLWRDPIDMLRAVTRYGDPARFCRVYDRQIKVACLLGLLLMLALRVASLWSLPLLDSTEGRYGAIVLEMHETGDWVTPHVWSSEDTTGSNEKRVPFLGKPPLYFWLGAATLGVLGPSEGATRLPSLITSAAMLWLIFITARLLFGSTVAWLAALIAGSSASMLAISGLAALDAIAGCCATGMIASFVHGFAAGARRPRAWRHAFFAFLGLGMLAKGPVVLVLGVMPVVLYLAWSRQLAWLGRLPWASGSVLALAIAAPWYVAAERENPGFWRYFFYQEHILRYLTSEYGDLYGKARKSVYGVSWAMLALSVFPWCLFVLGSWRRAAERVRALLKARTDWRWLIAFWAVAGAVFFTPARSVLPTYLFPSLGGIALLLALEVDRVLRHEDRWRAALLATAAVPWLSLVGLALYGVFQTGTVHHLTTVAVLSAFAGIGGAWLFLRLVSRPLHLLLVPVSFGFALTGWWMGVSEQLETEGSSAVLLDRARASVEEQPHVPIVLIGRGEPSMDFYARDDLTVVRSMTDPQLGEFLSDDRLQAYIIRSKLREAVITHHPKLEIVETLGRFTILREPR